MTFLTSLFRRVLAKKTTNKEPEPPDYRGLDDRDNFKEPISRDTQYRFYLMQERYYNAKAQYATGPRRRRLLVKAWDSRTKALNHREGYA